MKVDRACTAGGEATMCPMSFAPPVPKRYPTTLTTITLAAVNSMLSARFRQISTISRMVSIVSTNSSLTPVKRHTSATAACSMAKKWMIPYALSVRIVFFKT